MPAATNHTEAPIAVRIDLAAIFVSLELSRSKWLITSLSPGAGERMSKAIVPGGDVPALLARFAELQRAQGKAPKLAITAAMRKLLITANVIIQQDRTWTPHSA